ncbi:hypothetical protein D1AOALGA4SA_2008 [Olavius algarvensis Delta 1 endosymbiont]|nr:hypothetical protein D1AOALGA4SA_2008 [Olavius algarvensis Delta 1 endosymbiont]
MPAHPVPLQREERGCHDLLHCYILDFIRQNFNFFISLRQGSKMPSVIKSQYVTLHKSRQPLVLVSYTLPTITAPAPAPLERIGSF